MKQAVIFDMDGVLVDTEPVYFGVSRLLFERLGIEVSQEELHGFVGISATTLWGGLRNKFGLKPSVEELISLEKEAQYLKLSEMPSIPPIEGIQALIETFQEQQLCLSIASSSPVKIIDLILNKSKLTSYFEIIVSGQEVTNGKPHPDIFHLSSQKLGVASGNCLVIEDSPHGIAGAKAAGMKCIGFQNPNSGNQDLSGADMIIKDFSENSRQEILDFVYNKIQKVQ